MDDVKGGWVEVLPSVLWVYWTTPKLATREMPFSLVYGTRVVVLVEIELETTRVNTYDGVNAEQGFLYLDNRRKEGHIGSL